MNQKNDPKTYRIYARLSSSEWEKFEQLRGKSGLSQSDFVRAKTLGGRKIKAKYDRELLLETLGQLGKIGSNLNQIAKANNKGLKAEIPSGLADQIDQVGQQILKALSHGH